MQHHHLVLHAEPKNGRLFRLHCLSRRYGRLWCSAMAPKHCVFSSPSLIEAIIEPMENGTLCARKAEIVDTFLPAHANQTTIASLILLSSIIEKCVPIRAETPQTFDLLLNLFQDIALFTDWKVPPFILAMSFFEQEGIDLSQFSQRRQLSDRSRTTIDGLKQTCLNDLYALSIEPELLLASLESIGITEQTRCANFR
jgi:hypothetical protein